MIYSTVAIIILIVIIYHERDLKAVAKAEQERKELIKQLEKELEELNKELINAEKRTEDLHDKYMDRCIESGVYDGSFDDDYHESCAGRQYRAYKAMESKWDTLSNKCYSTERKIEELRNFYRR